MRIATSYIPHALSAIAAMSMSRARISIPEPIAERQPSSNGDEEPERLKRLVRVPVVKESKDATAWKQRDFVEGRV